MMLIVPVSLHFFFRYEEKTKKKIFFLDIFKHLIYFHQFRLVEFHLLLLKTSFCRSSLSG